MALQYYYADDDERRGPVDLDALRAAGITRATLVWREGLSDWQPAGELPELDHLFTLPGGASATTEPADRPYAEPQAVPPRPPRAQPPVPRSQSRRKRYDDLGGAYPPKTWLVESILATILCCLPFGIAGIVNASRVESRYYAGDVAGAEQASRAAEKWTKWSVGIGLGGAILYFIFVILIGVTGNL